jgi:hypothetical protein
MKFPLSFKTDGVIINEVIYKKNMMEGGRRGQEREGKKEQIKINVNNHF